jgi:hypothetical protein
MQMHFLCRNTCCPCQTLLSSKGQPSCEQNRRQKTAKKKALVAKNVRWQGQTAANGTQTV